VKHSSPIYAQFSRSIKTATSWRFPLKSWRPARVI